MRLIGIDYGQKRVGIAVSDEENRIAFPRTILKNDKHLLDLIEKICQEEKIDRIVMGESYNCQGKSNKLMEKIISFKNELKKKLKLPIKLEKEFMTTIEARRYQENKKEVDSSAAALILQRYLDRLNIKRKD
ncbi:hypothetical protein A2995_01790 [Candidatus Nomurabacteria bacterium RIFCSPLOWO2_01_FULL_33_24]|uniref:Putative pre-16S rRNA nuclease n=1 Tax=Candidatus Nomurabacteria bacterium RIFCSPLOWO2_01_FULL_33_24 TaxID=1801765 RepID=A0A1F6X1V1_9BACT|nr:MAG: hypothetical protein A2995_01790 [Candidatus Nomurabacteria bacterium RIFCSPLOWO2_01_FULL_33_24]